MRGVKKKCWLESRSPIHCSRAGGGAKKIAEDAKFGLFGESLMHVCGLGVPVDIQRGLLALERLAQQGSSEAVFMLYMIRSGVGLDDLKTNPKKAIDMALFAADKGVPEFQYMVGVAFLEGKEVPKDVVAGERWLFRAASQGYAQAIAELGSHYANQQRYAQAVPLFRLGVVQGSVEAQYLLGTAYANGWGVPVDYALARKWMQLAADKKYAFAQYAIGWLYANGHGVPRDYVEAMKWYRLATDQGLPVAQEATATAYEYGLGVTKNLKEALVWRRAAAASGFMVSRDKLSAEKMYPVDSSKTNLEEGAKWYRLDAEDGSGRAQLRLARYLHRSRVVEAVLWYKLAADQGDSEAMSDLGGMYLRGNVVPRDPELGLKYLRMAASSGDLEARFMLGREFLMGESVPRSLVLAYALQFTVRNTAPNFEEMLSSYEPTYVTQMTSDELLQAKQLARALAAPAKFQSEFSQAQDKFQSQK